LFPCYRLFSAHSYQNSDRRAGRQRRPLLSLQPLSSLPRLLLRRLCRFISRLSGFAAALPLSGGGFFSCGGFSAPLSQRRFCAAFSALFQRLFRRQLFQPLPV
jgi:hypothetical protein